MPAASEVRETSLATPRAAEEAPSTERELRVENDNPTWTLLMHFGALARGSAFGLFSLQ